MLMHPRRARALVRTAAAYDPTSTKPLSALLGSMGKGMEYVPFTEYRLSDDKAQFIRDEIVGGFAMGGTQVDAIRRGAAIIRAAGADLMLVEVPCADEFIDMYPNGQADAAAASDLLQTLAQELNVPFVPISARMPLDWYYDAVHLNGTGMREWTAELGPVISRTLEGREPAMSGAFVR